MDAHYYGIVPMLKELINQRAGNYDEAFDDGSEYGEILFARTLLEQIGETFEYPVMKKDD